MRYHFTPTRMAIKNKTTTKKEKITSLGKVAEKHKPSHIAGEIVK